MSTQNSILEDDRDYLNQGMEKEELPLDVLRYLVDWFKQNVIETDSGYKQCFLENGLR